MGLGPARRREWERPPCWRDPERGEPQRPQQTMRPARLRSARTDQLPQMGQAMNRNERRQMDGLQPEMDCLQPEIVSGLRPLFLGTPGFVGA